MKRTVPIVLLTAAGFVPGTAYAAQGPGEGVRCGYTSMVNPFTSDRQFGEVDAGPVVIADGTDPRAGRIRCTIQLNGERHADPDAASVSSVTTPGVVWLPSTPVEYEVGDGDWVVLCTEVTIDGAGTFYWDEEENVWSTSPDVPCVGSIDPPSPILDDVERIVDDVVCPLFVEAAPGAGPVTIGPDGDIAVADGLVWDCPPYEWES